MDAGQVIVVAGFVGLAVLALRPERKPKAGSAEWLREHGESLYRYCWHVVKREQPHLSPSQRIVEAQRMVDRIEAQRRAEFRESEVADAGPAGPAGID